LPPPVCWVVIAGEPVILFQTFQNNEHIDRVKEWIEFVALGIELLAVTLIVVAIVFATVSYIGGRIKQVPADGTYARYRARLGAGLLLGLEVLVAADVVRTVAFDPTLESAAVLGLLVVIRTFLSWSLVVEIENRWPWQTPKEETTEPT
jgi:uncharacterized membrane protein